MSLSLCCFYSLGTFGQKDLWNIKDRMSWRRGPNPNFNPDSCTTPATTTSRAVASEPSCATAGENKANSTEVGRLSIIYIDLLYYPVCCAGNDSISLRTNAILQQGLIIQGLLMIVLKVQL